MPTVLRLFSIQVFKNQVELFEKDIVPTAILREILSENLVRELKTRTYVGLEKENIDDNHVYFKLARSRTVRTEEPEGGVLKPREHPDYPSVEVIVNIPYEICFISKNSHFASSMDVAREHLRKLLEASTVAKRSRVDIAIKEIRDPSDFLGYIDSARIIKDFYFDVRRSNQFNSAPFTKALKEMNDKAGIARSRTYLKDSPVSQEVAKELAQSSASTGEDAGGKFKLSPRGRFIPKSLKKKFVDVEFFEDIREIYTQVVQKMHQEYRRVRGEPRE